MIAEIRCESSIEDIYTLCGVDKNDKVLCVLTHYSDDDATGAKSVKVDFGRKGKYEIYFLDEKHDAEPVAITDKLELTMMNNSCVMIKEV